GGAGTAAERHGLDGGCRGEAPGGMSLPLEDWLQMDAHFFMRPNLASLVMVDLDDHDGSLQDVLSLAPRALVQTSPRCFQIWYTLDQRFAASDAATVTRELSQILGGDTRSARTTQVGRMPGSINRKPQKMAPAMLLHSCLQNLNEAQYLHMVRPPLLRLQGGGVHVEALKDKPVVDRSREDWGIACRYFESHPAATVDDAVRDCQLTATRPNQAGPLLEARALYIFFGIILHVCLLAPV
ncbi:unnamed protein product, partial [Effrenium voratum]